MHQSLGLTLANRGVITGIVKPQELHIALRMASRNQRGQLERFLAEVAPALAAGP